MKPLLALLLIMSAPFVRAAQVTLSWTNPSQNTDGSALTNLSAIIITYGPCSADHTYIDGARGALGEFVVMTAAAGAAMSQVETFAAKGDTCFVAVAQNTLEQMSAQSNVAVWTSSLSAPKQPIAAPGQPIPIGSVIHLTFKHKA